MSIDKPLSPHDRYVAAGGCPFVTLTKTWCNGRAGHATAHWAMREVDGGAPQLVILGASA